jgi:hypothetical protein
MTGDSWPEPNMQRLIRVRYLSIFVLAGFCEAETNGVAGVRPRSMYAYDS